MAQFTFDHWEVNGVMYTSVPLNITITADTIVIAIYRETGIPPPVGAGFLIWVIPVTLIGIGAIYILGKRKK